MTTIREEEEQKDETFISTLIASEPSLEYVFRGLPHTEAESGTIVDLMIQEKLVVASDGGDNQDGRIVCAIALASEDMLDYHISSHEVYGEPKDSGRAEMMGVTAAVVYLCQLIKWHGLPVDTRVNIYCDNEETVDFANKKWIGETPKWADGRNIELKRTIRDQLNAYGREIKVVYVSGTKTMKRNLKNSPYQLN